MIQKETAGRRANRGTAHSGRPLLGLPAIAAAEMLLTGCTMAADPRHHDGIERNGCRELKFRLDSSSDLRSSND